MVTINQGQIWAEIAQAAINYIVVSTISGNSQKSTVTDMKTDLRTTKEDLMAEIKESRSLLMDELAKQAKTDENNTGDKA